MTYLRVAEGLGITPDRMAPNGFVRNGVAIPVIPCQDIPMFRKLKGKMKHAWRTYLKVTDQRIIVSTSNKG